MSIRSSQTDSGQPSSASENHGGEMEGTVPPPEGGTKPPSTTPTLIKSDSPPQTLSNIPTSAFAASAVSADFTPGSVLGPYQLMEKLGQGGMGAVYKARHQHLDMVVALKVLPQQFTQQPESVARFKREMKAVGRIRHANIVQAMDAGEIDGTQYLAMEYIEGSDLAKLVATKGAFSVANACKAVKQAAQALSAAHAAGLVHRDIKPSNLLLAKSGQIKILDLGLALLGEDSGQTSEVTAHGQTFGTPDYMAPEQWADSHAVDARTDLYALGCTLFYLLVGRAPYSDDKHRTPLNKMTGHVMDPVPDLKAVRADTPDAVAGIYRKLMAKKPEERYQSAAELVEALNRFAAGKSLPEETSPSLPVASSVLSVEATLPKSSPSGTDVEPVVAPTLLSEGAIVHETIPTQRPRNQRAGSGGRPRWAILVAPVLLACLAGGLYVAFANRGEPKPQVAGVTPADAPSSDPQPAGWHGWPADAPKPAIAPFDAEQAKKHQEEWAAYLKVPVEWENSIGMKFRLIPPGEFWMGSSDAEIEWALKQTESKNLEYWTPIIKSEGPPHLVRLSGAVYLGAHEVTQAQYEKIMAKTPAHFASTGAGKDVVKDLPTEQFPVEQVNWLEAMSFCRKLSVQEGMNLDETTPSDQSVLAASYRLPTEAEWEYACRAGTTTRFWTGDTEPSLAEAGWYVDHQSQYRTHRVGELLANPFGLFDVHGNVWEWVQDGWFQDAYRQSSDIEIDPYRVGESANSRVIRGGAWLGSQEYCRSSKRYQKDSTQGTRNIGFRITVSVDSVKRAIQKISTTGWHGWPADAPKPAIAPFDAEQAKKHQEEWAAYLKVPVEWENSIGMKFRLIPPGEFLMGSTEDEIQDCLQQMKESNNPIFKEIAESSGPQHTVVITKPYYLGLEEVQASHYSKIMGKDPSTRHLTGPGNEFAEKTNRDKFPVETVSWNDAAEFCALLSQAEELKPFYLRVDNSITPLTGTGYRLPTEAEWEMACRAGTTTRFWTGDLAPELLAAAWHQPNAKDQTQRVGELQANPFGLYDVHGNVWEWVQDWWTPKFYSQFQTSSAIDPLTPSSSGRRVIRGGHCSDGHHNCSSSVKFAHGQTQQYSWVGFRAALPVDAVKELLERKQKSIGIKKAGWHGWPADAPNPAIAPFDAAQAKRHQDEWAAYLKVPVEWENSIGMKFRLIPPGEFLMGSTAEEQETYRDAEPSNRYWPSAINSEGPQHRTVLTKPFYLSAYETRQRDYEQVVGSQPSHFASTGTNSAAVELLDTANFPVEHVSWNDAVAYCGKLGAREGIPEFYSRSEQRWLVAGGEGYRLPTEAEWELACRAGTTTTFWSGPRELDAKGVAWTKENSNGRPHAVGELAPNPFGLYDIHGNVPECCHDGYTNASYERYALQSAVDPVVKPEEQSNPLRKYRGGDFSHPLAWARSAMRSHLNDDTAGPGFRLALSIDAVRRALKVNGPVLPAAIQTPSP